ncbi:MAG: phosphatidylcholine/phosphatidylserine synthase [Xanthomonadales bacterium]|nr:phosphatidylcholine/phosphatidylserine synthase [Xanthomonadales bacterium]MCB1626724.1 phosphatidylcholine/phosphatidylserine synthase [Xanthomonadales bacterium]MCB1634192.1 phosphatidylcholine/phosphatidylserine synthase [Xanthomonadales bacterium]MCB1641338.1 phosphatidylcholine/phosphatidylserine synthase [Xanthomonadales bacterium]
MNHSSDEVQRRPAAIYLLPNLFTTGALFAGFYAIVAAFNGLYETAAVAVFVAALLDGLDGRVARLTKTQSEFGTQYDSLADMVSFGLAPALVVYSWSLSGLKAYGVFWGKVGWLVAFLFAACAALRLARFNANVGKVDKHLFQGLASPAAAGTLMALVWAVEDFGGNRFALVWVTPFLTVALGLAMVSRLPYYSFKVWPERVRFVWILLLVVALALLAAHPPNVLLVLSLLYASSGPVYWLFRRWRRHRRVGVWEQSAQVGAKDDSEQADGPTGGAH